MFSFFGHRNKDSSKKSSSSEGDTDGFVIIGETVEEQRQKIQNISKPSCNVIVQPSKSSSATPSQAHHSPAPVPPSVIAPSPGPMWKPPAPIVEAPPSLPELLGDVPFTLAPHVLAMQTGGPGFLFSEMLMSPQDINHNLASFTYDFTLENSVLCDH
ncbi:UBAP1-MVB12-associated (UMA)-domain containing protein 1 [Oncorhynchus masou masou]|uniref:UBAP1-MVB12-associated (UMA)-domain containing protein 1 n=1 Tax=Oncorhynchus masou masou TaxID=90313 RepID=UPI003182EA65